MSALGTLDELPVAYIDGLTAHNLVPLWPSLRKALPHGGPFRRTQPVLLRYADVRPRLWQAGELTPIDCCGFPGAKCATRCKRWQR
jgi:gentisate 1,2-dioxygenase